MVVELTPEEARVLGCLMEKAATTPDYYPLSLNALITACNQTTNRDPVVHYDEDVVEETLASLRSKGLATRGKAPGERAIKHRHRVEETLQLDGAGVALLGVLLLRGPQTPGELKVRTDRWHPFATLDDVERGLADLAAREFAARAERRPGQKETRWVQLLSPVEVQAVTRVSTGSRGHVRAGASVEADEEPRLPAPPKAAASIVLHNPANGEVLREVAVDGEDEVRAKVARARAAQREWARRSYADRAAAITAFRELLAEEADELAAITTRETGKPITQSHNEIRAAQDRVAYFVEHTERLLAPEQVTNSGDLEESITYDPVGVVAHVSAWNYPYFVAFNSVIPALLAGNAVLYKPSEHATLTGLAIVDRMHRSGVPVDVLQAVVGDGATGSLLVAADGVDMVCFTGSYETGKRVAKGAAEHLARVQLELGGKDGAYVTDDIDVARTAASVAEGVFYNGGQSCCAIERIYVHTDVWDDFVTEFAVAAESWRAGDPMQPDTNVGPLARAAQVELLREQVRDATNRGATVLVGGEDIDGPGNWFAPTVLVDVNHTMKVMRDESFGPVIGLMRVDDDAHAAKLMDDTEYGLTGAIFTRSRERAERFLAQLDTGSVYWNCSDRTSVTLPWAGRRRSGLGVSMADDGIRAFTRPKAWHARP
jgi:acyl-CoA reductase-like NAD-dependent aldehyde dehydrogenase